MKAGVGDLGKVVVLIVVADIVSNGIQRPIVAIRLLPLHDITPALQQDIPIYIATRAAQPARVTEQCSSGLPCMFTGRCSAVADVRMNRQHQILQLCACSMAWRCPFT